MAHANIRRQQRRRPQNREVALKKCKGECKLQVTRIVNIADPVWKHGPKVNPGTTPKGGDLKAMSEALGKTIEEWAKPIALDGHKCADDRCECVQSDVVDWEKKVPHKRTFQDNLESGDGKFIVSREVEFKVATVNGNCVEKDPIWKAYL